MPATSEVQNLHHVCEIQYFSQTGVNSHNEQVGEWVTEATRRFSFVPTGSREYYQASQVQAELTHMVRMRYYAGLSAKKRLLHNSKAYYLTGPPMVEPEGKPQWLVFGVKETNP